MMITTDLGERQVSILNFKIKDEYDIRFDAFGEGLVCNDAFGSSFDRCIEHYREECGKEPQDISFLIENNLTKGPDNGFKEIETAFLERFEGLKELILPDSITEIRMTDKLLQILKDNNTLIRGSLDSFAERFAAYMGLNFRPADFVFARHEFEKTHEITVLTLVFRRDGRVVIRADVDSPGSAAGNSFGGVFYKELPADFWMNMTAEEISEMYPGLDGAVAKDGRLADFITKAKSHKIYTGKN